MRRARLAVAASTWVFWSVVSGLPAQPAQGAGGAAEARFVVALALSADQADGLTWPHALLPPAPYEQLVMIVDAVPGMPAPPGGPEAWREVRVAGRPPEPADMATRATRGLPGRAEQQFIVNLARGRLRLTLASSGQARGRAPASVRIRLYELIRVP